MRTNKMLCSGESMQYYSICLNDNDSYMCSSTDKVFDDVDNIDVCPKCHYRTNFEFINPKFVLKKKTYDISSTYDGYFIASLKLKESINRERLSGIEFIPIVREPEYFVMFVHNLVLFNTEKRKSKAEKYCLKCGNYESFVGATPAFLKSVPRFDLSRTDVSFGSGNEKSPLLIANDNFVSFVKREKLTGFYFEPTKT